MQVVPPNLHIGSNIGPPLYSLLIMGFVAIIVGVLITRSLPRFLGEFITVVLVHDLCSCPQQLVGWKRAKPSQF